MNSRLGMAAIVAASVLAFNMPVALAVTPDEDSVVSQNFKAMGRELRNLRNAGDEAALVGLLAKVRDIAQKNHGEVPSFMKAGSPEHADFRKGLEEMMAQIDTLLAQANGGDWQGAKDKAGALGDFRDRYHEHFGIED